MRNLFVSVSMSGPDMETKVFKGTVSGEIADGKYGDNGFGLTTDILCAEIIKRWRNFLKKKRSN